MRSTEGKIFEVKDEMEALVNEVTQLMVEVAKLKWGCGIEG